MASNDVPKYLQGKAKSESAWPYEIDSNGEVKPMEHITDGTKCWCDPEVIDGVIVHRRTDN